MDAVNGIALDSQGNLYATGVTSSLDFPASANAIQPGFFGFEDAFVVKFDPSGSLLYSTYLGGVGNDQALAVAADSSGAAYVTGSVSEGEFPTTTGAFNTLGFGQGTNSAFIAKLHPAGCAILYSSYVSGAGLAGIRGTGIAVDAAGNAYVVGNEQGAPIIEPPLPLALVNSLQPRLSSVGLDQAFVSEFDSTGAKLLFSSGLGGSQGSEGYGIALDPSGNIDVAGSTYSPDFPSVNAEQPACFSCQGLNNLASGAFVAKINPSAPPPVSLTRSSLIFGSYPINTTNYAVQAVGLMNSQSVPLNISSVAITPGDFSVIPPNDPNSVTAPCSGAIASGTGCGVFIRFVPTAEGTRTATLTITDDGPGSPRNVLLTGTGQADFMFDFSPAVRDVIRADSFSDVVFTGQVPGAPAPTGNLSLTCANIAPAVCTFQSNPIPVGSSTSLTVSNMNAINGNVLNFSVVGTLGTQTAVLPFTVTLEDYSVSASPASTTITAGQSASFNLTINPQAGFHFGVNLSCATNAPQAACSVNPTQVDPDGTNPSTAVVKLTTTARSAEPGGYRVDDPHNLGFRLRQWPAAWQLWLVLVIALMYGNWRVGRRRSMVLLLAIMMFLSLWAACGGGGGVSGTGGGGGSPSGTVAGSYKVTISTVVVVSGASVLSHQAVVTVTVN